MKPGRNVTRGARRRRDRFAPDPGGNVPPSPVPSSPAFTRAAVGTARAAGDARAYAYVRAIAADPRAGSAARAMAAAARRACESGNAGPARAMRAGRTRAMGAHAA